MKAALRASALFAATWAGIAHAEPPPSADVRTFRPSIDPRAGLVLEPATTQGHLVPNFAAFVSHGARPVTLSNGTDRFRLESVVATDFVASLGLGDRFALGASLPLSLVNVRSFAGTTPSSGESDVPRPSEVAATALGDLALSGKATLRSNADGGLGVAAVGSISLPTGSTRGFAGEGSVTASARALFDFDVYVGRVNASLGFKARGESATFATERGAATLGHEIPWTFGIGLRPAVVGLDPGDRQVWEIGVRGSLPAGPSAPFGADGANAAAVSPTLLALSDRLALGRSRDVSILVGADFGLTNAIGTPLLRTVVGISWSPKNHDQDGDGVPDDVDLCPPIPEDADGFEDSDGCPEIDDDDDGVVDREDACPREPGAPSSDPKANGCPPDRQWQKP